GLARLPAVRRSFRLPPGAPRLLLRRQRFEALFLLPEARAPRQTTALPKSGRPRWVRACNLPHLRSAGSPPAREPGCADRRARRRNRCERGAAREHRRLRPPSVGRLARTAAEIPHVGAAGRPLARWPSW